MRSATFVSVAGFGGWDNFPGRVRRASLASTLGLVALVMAIAGSAPLAARSGPTFNPALVFDADSGLVLYAEDPDYRWHPASLTKLMTAYLTFEALREGRLRPSSKLTCTAEAHAQEPTKLGLSIANNLDVAKALKALIIKSANDVAVMLGDGIGAGMVDYNAHGGCERLDRASLTSLLATAPCRAKGGPPGRACRIAPPEPPPVAMPAHGLGAVRYAGITRAREDCRLGAFIKHMNETAKRLGMTRTRFVNPNGLPDSRQITTARDLGLLTRAIIKEYPEHNALFGLLSARIGRRVIATHNGMLRSYTGADGMKTGFICASGFNIVASATRDGHRLVAVVLGSPTSGHRNQRARRLLDYGYTIYPWKSALESDALDALPRSPLALLGPLDIRRSVRSYACGTARRHVRRKRKGKSRKRRVARKRPTKVKHRPSRPIRAVTSNR